MTPEPQRPAVRGWCPTVHAPMPTGDGLLVRVKPFAGHLSAAALHALANAVTACANGIIELTGRGNLQIRGVHAPAAFAAAMVQAGLADPDAAREARRNVVTVPPCDDALATAAEAIMASTGGLTAKRYVTVSGSTITLDGQPCTLAALPARLLCAPTTRRDADPQRPEIAHLLHLPSAQTTPATLHQLATLTPGLRTTPWRAFLSPVAIPGFATPATVTTCIGAPGCASATTPTRAHAAHLQALGVTGIHLSGCSKGCAHPAPTRTLVARHGRYDLIRHGRASDTPDLCSLTLEQAAFA